MKTFYTVIMIAALSGCASKSVQLPKEESQLSTRIEYVIKLPPKNLLEIPPQVNDIDIDQAKQSDIAQWMLLNEERMRKLENMLIELGKFFKAEEAATNKEDL